MTGGLCYARQWFLIYAMLLVLSRGLASCILYILCALQYTTVHLWVHQSLLTWAECKGDNMTNRYNYNSLLMLSSNTITIL